MKEMQKNLENALVRSLNNGYVIFTYKKLDGTTRQAVGTRCFDLIKRVSDWRPVGGRENNSTINYFDLVEGGWRSFRCGNLVDIATARWHRESQFDSFVVNEAYAIKWAIKAALELNYVQRVVSLTDTLLFGLSKDVEITMTMANPAKSVMSVINVCDTKRRSVADVVSDIKETQRRMDDLVEELDSLTR